MSGHGLMDCQRERGRFDLSRRRDFGSYKSRKRRDKRMARQLAEAAAQTDLIGEREHVQALARLLDYEAHGEPVPSSRASWVGQGYVRLLVGGATYRLVRQTQRRGQYVAFGTLIFRGGELRPDQVASADPRLWRKQLHAALDYIRTQHGLTGPGWSIWILDAAYLDHEGLIVFHWHGFASGTEHTAADLLRRTPKYRPTPKATNKPRDLARRRVVLSRRQLCNVGYLCLYLLKESWVCETTPRNVPGNRQRSYPRPLPRSLLPMERLFFDKWSIADISVVRGVRVIKRQLTPRPKLSG